MRRPLAMWMAPFLASCLLTGAAGAQEAIPAQDVVPSKDQTGVVHVSAMKNPEMHSYRAIVAGLDIFDALHALAPDVPRLLFAARSAQGGPLRGAVPAAKLSGDDFSLSLPLDGEAQFSVPRNQQAWDSKAELVLDRKRREVRVWPSINSPGLRANQRRLGDIRLECQVVLAVAKKEAPLWAVALVNTVILTPDWCGFMKNKDRLWDVAMAAPLASAVLVDGNRSAALKVKGNRFRIPIGDTSWSNDALIEVAFAAPDETGANEASPTRTADGTPRTGP
jgi:hypothetical protein